MLVWMRLGRAWNESSVYHFIGKDIVYHHYLFLPAVRMGIDYEYKLPDYMPTRGHLLLYDKKSQRVETGILACVTS